MEKPKDRWVQLLVLAYWTDHGLRSCAPPWVLKHPMWPPNNDAFKKELAGTACQGRDRLWEAIAAEFDLDLTGVRPS